MLILFDRIGNQVQRGRLQRVVDTDKVGRWRDMHVITAALQQPIVTSPNKLLSIEESVDTVPSAGHQIQMERLGRVPRTWSR